MEQYKHVKGKRVEAQFRMRPVLPKALLGRLGRYGSLGCHATGF